MLVCIKEVIFEVDTPEAKAIAALLLAESNIESVPVFDIDPEQGGVEVDTLYRKWPTIEIEGQVKEACALSDIECKRVLFECRDWFDRDLFEMAEVSALIAMEAPERATLNSYLAFHEAVYDETFIAY